ncbi:MAG: response regulator transcription factor [Phycisphaerae bacterium]
MPRSPTIYVVDDDPATRRALQGALERAQFRVRTYADATAFLKDFQNGGIGCLLLDLQLPSMSGIELIERMRERKLHLPVIIISGHANVESAVKILKLGAVDLIEKPLDLKVVIERVREVIRRDTLRQQHHAVVQEIWKRLETLTPREMVLVKLLIQGKSNKMIGATLGISTKTVANHRAHVMAKTQASNAADLVRMVLTVEQAQMLDAALDKHYL